MKGNHIGKTIDQVERLSDLARQRPDDTVDRLHEEWQADFDRMTEEDRVRLHELRNELNAGGAPQEDPEVEKKRQKVFFACVYWLIRFCVLGKSIRRRLNQEQLESAQKAGLSANMCFTLITHSWKVLIRIKRVWLFTAQVSLVWLFNSLVVSEFGK